MSVNRRDLLKFAAGSGAGIAFTPLPWKLLDDSAIWTQNWSLTPRLPRGEVTKKFTTCTLCPAGCGVEARCVNGRPFGLAGVELHPASHGALCAAGVGGHYVAYHPGRVRRVLHRGRPAELRQAIAALREAKGRIGVLDGRPGRAVSEAWRRFTAALPDGVYITPEPRDGATLGIDLENTKTLLSFGAPILDGWAAPGRVWAARAGFRLIQADPRESPTALLADSWLRIRPGTEAALALGFANVILRDGLAHADAARAGDFAAYRTLAERFTPDRVSSLAGIPADAIVAAAREFAGGAPAVAVGGEFAAALNLLVGSVGRRGGVVARREPWNAAGTALAGVPDASLAALLIDDAGDRTPWNLVRKKLAQGAVVVCLTVAPFAHADFVVPAPAYLESYDDAPAPFDSPCARYSISAPVAPKPAGVLEPAELLAALAEAYGLPNPGSTEDLLKQRAAEIHRLARGSVFSYADRAVKPAADFKTADEFYGALVEGACWADDPPAEDPPRKFRFNAAEPVLPGGAHLALLPYGSRAAALSPMMSKLYQESDLQRPPGEVAVHPATAKDNGLDDGCAAVVRTDAGERRVRVRVSASVMPRVIEDPGLLEIHGAPAAAIRRAS